MLFHTRFASETGVYIGQMHCNVQGHLDVPCFRLAWEALVQRHQALRTSFHFEDVEQPLQVVHTEAVLPLVEEDLRSRSADDRAAYVQHALAADRCRPFDLHQPPLMRLHLFRMSDVTTKFVWTRHHILMDGWSVNILMDELFTLYQAAQEEREAGLSPSRPYYVFVDWLERWAPDTAEAFWRQTLSGFGSPTPLVPEETIRRGDALEVSLVEAQHSLSREFSERLRDFAQSHHLTVATVLTGAWALLVGRYSGANDVVFGMTFSGRPADVPGVESIVGLFLNTLPVRVHVSLSTPLISWLQGLQERLTEYRQHEHTPLVDLHRFTDLPMHQPLFSHILVLENYPMGMAGDGPLAFGDLTIDDCQFIDQTNFPLNVGVVPGRQMSMLVVYDPTRFESAFIRQLLDNFDRLLQVLVESGQTPIGALDILTANERRYLLEELNATAVTWPAAGGLLDRIAAQTQATPDAMAVMLGHHTLTYAELDGAANALAHQLVRRGVGPEAVVGVCLERSLNLVVTLLAILKASGAYLPLDLEEPTDRLRFMLQDAEVDLVVTTPDWQATFSAAGVPVETVDGGILATSTDAPPPSTVRDARAIYVIYTSGSTGQPKAVVNVHGALLNRLLWMQSAYPIGPGDRVLQKTPYTFDVSVWEFFWPLLTGATIVLADPGGHRDPAYLRDLIVQAGITVLHFVPSMLRSFLQEEGIEACTTLRHLISSGEALSPDLRDLVQRRLGTALHNLYGPTEAAIDVTFHNCEASTPSVPIGRPISNTQVYLLHPSSLEPVPRGAIGELYLGGDGLARGYLGRPSQTADRFVPDPFTSRPGARLYRTGDLGRLDASGQLLYLGRVDAQIKIRGLRVELGEIEAALRACPGVRNCAVVADVAASGDVQLIGHIIAEDQGEAAERVAAAVDTYHQQLRARLPEHMIPRHIVLHHTFPFLPSGKLDRAALSRQAGVMSMGTRRIDAPRTPVEAELAAIWQEVLGLSAVGVQENFFELGGHSLLLTQVNTRIRQAFGVDLTLRSLFNAQTIAETTEMIMQHQIQQESPEEVARLMEELRGLSPEEIADLLSQAGEEGH